MANFNSILTHFTALSPEERGKAFEHYCKWFLENDPRYKMQLRNVWLWKDWPGKWGRDKGIDLIAETHQGKLWAIQAKAYDHAYPITKDDVDSFLSESSRQEISFRLLIATTNNIGHNARDVINNQEKPVATCLLDALEASELNCEDFLNHQTAPHKRELRIPRPHQEKALHDIVAGFATSSRGQVRMACGTGKTLVGLWTAERLQSTTTLVLVPSISLIAQIYRDWANNCSNDFSFSPLFVCSDQTVGDKDDEENIGDLVASLGLPVTTDPVQLLRDFSAIKGAKVIFSTYQSSAVIKAMCALDTRLSFDLVIADEAHRCAGKASSEFATVVDATAIRATRKLFMTATPKIFSDHVKKTTQEAAIEIASMDDEAKFGPVLHKLPFSAAIQQNILSDYQVVISVMDDKTYQEYAERGRFVVINEHETDARTLASQLLVAKAIQRYDLKKIITFHNSKKNAREFIKNFSQAEQLLAAHERPIINYKNVVLGEMLQSERVPILNLFRQESAGCKILGNVRCLSEGVDVPELDGVAFIDPKGSEIDIVQAVGRAIRKPKNLAHKVGTIIIPIFVDTAANEEESLEQSCFKPIWKVLKALRAHDDVLAEELDTIRLELGKRTYKAPAKLGKIILDVPIGIDGTFFSESLRVKIVENCSRVSLAQSHPEIAVEWHPTKNSNLTPNDVTAGSGKKVWWKCPEGLDHEWQARIASRQDQGCAICAGQKVTFSNCLATTNPELIKEWHPTKNGNLMPHDITAGSNRKVWWQCSKGLDHAWQAIIRSRKNGGCSICLGRKVVPSNCLATTNPKLALEWHPTKNGNLTPNNVTGGSGKKVWWQCSKGSDHEWQAVVQSRKVQDCAICAGKKVVRSNCLATTNPELAQEWHPIKNGDLTPNDVIAGTARRVWWQCSKGLDHEWQTRVVDRQRFGCAMCARKKIVSSNSLATINPKLAQEWHASKNGTLTPYDVTAGSHKEVWWQCFKKHEWVKEIRYRAQKKVNCPECKKQFNGDSKNF